MKAIIELEFDSVQEVTVENILEYIHTLVENDQLYIEFYDNDQTPLIFGA